MDTENPPYYGERLQSLVDNPLPLRSPLIEQLLYEHSVIMTYAKSGAGKSVISLCAALQASAGEKVFGFFEVPRPLKIYYILGERDITEPAERLQFMKRAFQINCIKQSLFIDDEAVGKNLLDQHNETWICKRIEKYLPNVDIIFLDPIYSLVSGGMSNPEKATAFAQFSTRLQKRFGCSNWLNNHTTKYTTEIINGKVVEKEDPFFGSELLKAHINFSYYIKQTDSNIVKFSSTKDSQQASIKSFSLKFDPETYTLSFDIKGGLTAQQKAQSFILHIRETKSSFDFDDFFEIIQPAALRYTQKILGKFINDGIVINTSNNFVKAEYKVV